MSREIVLLSARQLEVASRSALALAHSAGHVAFEEVAGGGSDVRVMEMACGRRVREYVLGPRGAVKEVGKWSSRKA